MVYMVLGKTLESPLDSKEMKPFNPKGNQPWIFIGRIDAEAEAPIFWPPEAKSQLTGKDPDAGKDWGQEEKQVTENEIVGSHHWINGREFEQTLEDSEGLPRWLSGKESACQCRRLKRRRFDPWVRKWQPTSVFLPGKYHRQRSLKGCSPWGHKDSNTTEHSTISPGDSEGQGGLACSSPQQ